MMLCSALAVAQPEEEEEEAAPKAVSRGKSPAALVVQPCSPGSQSSGCPSRGPACSPGLFVRVGTKRLGSSSKHVPKKACLPGEEWPCGIDSSCRQLDCLMLRHSHMDSLSRACTWTFLHTHSHLLFAQLSCQAAQ
jgi:hypothetical protein